ncbi:MAG: threonine synthase [Candidatus Marinimicrobia bacterium]|nr:threonine synthase [Candidatus Neomarinimicrobiota bacterium]|tara:strand:+ start:2140 stop:3516 length:1377 start_codon:yes stop_codon:yes gene_type:complete
MKYFSTRDVSLKKSFNDILYQGLSNDGGLYLPIKWPKIEIETLKNKSYEDVALEIIHPFVKENFSKNEISKILIKSYDNFSNSNIAPIKILEKNKYLLELIYGPTYAFKDYALQFLGNLFSESLNKHQRKITILGATSGDTGSAAIHAFKSNNNINVFILHPYKKVSPIQQKQMTTVEEKNIFNIAIEGNFDDCQKIVKELFLDKEIQNITSLTAVNSINWARLIPQIVYYFWAYLQIDKKDLNFIVPSGNFGNIFSAYVAKKMGLPINRLHIATNKNDILRSIILNGNMNKKTVSETYSPSMDIQISSNFERQMFETLGRDSSKINNIFSTFNKTGEYKFDKNTVDDFNKIYDASSVNDVETLETIKIVFDQYKYISDPHTATGLKVLLEKNSTETWVSLVCAHPAKFNIPVKKAINQEVTIPNELSKLFDKKEKLTILSNNTKEVKNFIMENIKYA